ncbi:uncharacterized protein E0L32_009765 [Thyridium curvatum]|uniref:Amino acid transporter n=1 Tax=Thyridium curvatum TaxID=1093900 RepID=A0A507AGG0_9PEZI|nr:uncharacterized protein E0L32_009765 [Thyridium curvatum]TPX08825.1 hypothetical protein E0L32_009765 [Thyridium curvatum]
MRAHGCADIPILKGIDLSPTSAQRLGPFTVAALILNRTIGTGIFSLPASILMYTGSPGVAITLWVVAGIIIMCLLLCWLELGMTVPLFSHVDEDGTQAVVSTPRSGGDKNFLEYIYHKPKFLATCVFGVIFIVFGHLAGNAIQFGISMATLTDPGCRNDDRCGRGVVVGWALGVVIVCALINISARQFAIGLNNLFAVAKVLFVVVINLIGIIYGTMNGDGCRQITWARKSPNGANVGYLCTSPYKGGKEEMLASMFEKISGKKDTSTTSTRAVNVILALFAFANIMTQTFTGSRVKQEIAKEGILPYSLMFATGSKSLISRLSRSRPKGTGILADEIDQHAEQVPIAATFLHSVFEVILILAAGLALDPPDAYELLTSLKVFTVVGILGTLTAGGLLYLNIDSWARGSRGRGWYGIVKFLPWLDPLPVLIATAGFALIVVGPFVSPSIRVEKVIHSYTGLLVAWIVFVSSVGWWLWLKFDLRRNRMDLHVERKPFIERDGENGELVLKAEILCVERIPARATHSSSSA